MRWSAGWVLLLAVAFAAGQQDAPCPLKYRNNSRLLFGGLHAPQNSCTYYWGGSCLNRSPGSNYWFEQCRHNNSADFGVCNATQRAAGQKIADQLHGGAANSLSPCDLYPYLRGRTLWLIGDSHTKQLFKALQCFLLDLWVDQRECLVDANAELVEALDDLPARRGESKCLHLMGNARVCYVGAVLGTSLLDSPDVAGGGVLPLLRSKLAARGDIFVVNFGVWHTKEKDGYPGMGAYRAALEKLGQYYQRTKQQWPHLLFRETPMSHVKDMEKSTCMPPPFGWQLNFQTGQLFIPPAARVSASAAELVRGGPLNSVAREVLPSYALPAVGGFSYSVPLFMAHPELRGTPALDCLHYCSPGLPEILVWELARVFKAGVTGIKPQPFVEPGLRRNCTDAPGTY